MIVLPKKVKENICVLFLNRYNFSRLSSSVREICYFLQEKRKKNAKCSKTYVKQMKNKNLQCQKQKQ